MVKKRADIIAGLFLFCTVILVGALFVTGVLKNKEYSQKVASQRTVSLEVKNRRGKLYDRNMIPMVEKKVSGLRIGDVSFKNTDGKEMMISTRYSDNSACHLIGYTDYNGRGVCGLEKTFDVYMSTPVYERINAIRGADGSIIETAGFERENPEEEGDSVVLTIDSHIQKICSKALSDAKVTGAVVVMDVSSFDVLAMASSPNYNQGDVSGYMKSQGGELVNRCVAPYNAGSIFKIVTICSAMENKALMPIYVCRGKTEIGEHEFNCHNREGHGVINPAEALAMSCNCSFYTMGTHIGAERILSEANKFGFGEKTICCHEFDENPGNLPRKKRYSLVDNINYAIGQGEILLTPLQVANMVSIIAGGGKAKKANVATKVIDYKGNIKRVLREVGSRQIVSKKTADFVGRAMRLAVMEGTASGLKDNPAKIAGKTGTAETGWTENGKNMVHGWFCGFFPYDNPRYAMAVLVENGGSGSMSAVPIFGKIAEEIIKFYPI